MADVLADQIKELEFLERTTEEKPLAVSQKVTTPTFLELKRSSSGESLADIIQSWDGKFDINNDDDDDSPIDLLPLPKLESEASWLDMFEDKQSPPASTKNKKKTAEEETTVEEHGDYQVLTTVYKKSKPPRAGTPVDPALLQCQEKKQKQPIPFKFDAETGTFKSSLPFIANNSSYNMTQDKFIEEPKLPMIAPAAEKSFEKSFTPEPKDDLNKIQSVSSSPKKVTFGVRFWEDFDYYLANWSLNG